MKTHAEQIAKLKELAQKAIDNGPGNWPFHSEAFKAHITPAAVLELIALAEKVGDHNVASGDVQIGSKTPREQRVYSQGYYAGRKKGLEEAAAAPAAPVAGTADTTTIITAELNVMVNHEIVSVVGFLLDVAQAAHLAMQDCEDCGDHYKVQREDFDALNAAMEKLEVLPDDRPGYTLSGPGKAEWALRDRGEAAGTFMAEEDARTFGTGFTVDGAHVEPSRVRVFTNKPVAEQGELPLLPDPAWKRFGGNGEDAFTVRQMHDYARAAIATSQQAKEVDHGNIFDLIREWAHLPEGQRHDAARAIIGRMNQSYAAGVADGKVLGAASHQAAEPIGWIIGDFPTRCRASFEMDGMVMHSHRCGAATTPVYTHAAPAIQQPQDERAAFEAWASAPVRASKLPLDRWATNDGYVDQRTYTAFYGWQARAGLANKVAAPADNCDVCAGTGTAFGKTCNCQKGAAHG